MTTTKTHDVEATLEQIGRLREAGADIVRVAVPGIPDADALPAIVAGAGLPIIADIHFNASLALRAHGHRRRGGAHQPRQHRRRRQGRGGRAQGAGDRHAAAHRRQLGLAARPPAPDGHRRSRRRARGGRDGGGRAAGAARFPRLQDLGQVVERAGHDRGLPPARRAGPVSAAPGRDRGRAARRRHGQVGRSASARCWPTASATRSASRSRPIRSRRSARRSRSSRRSGCASPGRT